MGRRIPRSLADIRDLPVGQYFLSPANSLGPRSVYYRCHACGTVIDLDDEEKAHTIGADGRVTPAVECSDAACGQREWLELDSFDFSDVEQTKPYEAGK